MDFVSLTPGLREMHGFAFIHVVLSQLSIAINTSSRRSIRITKRWPGKDFFFQGDRIMLSGRLTTDSCWSLYDPHLTKRTPLSLSLSLVCLHPHPPPPVCISTCRSLCLHDYFSVEKRPSAPFSSSSVVSFLIPLDDLSVFMFSVRFLSLLFPCYPFFLSHISYLLIPIAFYCSSCFLLTGIKTPC